MNDHLVEIFGEYADFIRAMNIDRLIEIARFADPLCHFDQLIDRLANGLRGEESDEGSQQNRDRVPTVVMIVLSVVAEAAETFDS